MSNSPARSAPLKPLTLPRSLSRVLSRLLAMTPQESLPLAKIAYDTSASHHQRSIAMRLRLRLLQEALQNLHTPVEEPPEPVVEILDPPAPEPEPEPEPVEEPEAKPAKTGKLVSMDLEGGALAMMMQGLGDNEDDDDDDDFFAKD